MPRRCRAPLFVFLCLSMAAAIPAAARTTPAVTVLGSGVTGRPLVLRGDITVETTGLFEAVRDFSDWREPAWLGWNDHGFTFHWSDAVAADGLVVAFNADPLHLPVGFSLTDFRDPTAPVELFTAAGLFVRSAWLRDGALLVATDEAVIAYDLADPSAPVFSGVVPVGALDGRRWFSEVGGTLCLVDRGAAVRLLEVNDPRHPRDLGVRVLSGDRIDAMTGGDGVLYALVAGPAPGGDTAVDLVTWNVTQAATLVETGRRRLCTGAGTRGRCLVRAGDLLLAAAGDGRLRAFGLADAAHPAPGWQLELDCDHLAVSAGAIFASTAAGLHVYGRVAHDQWPGEPIVRAPLPRFATVAGGGPVQVAQLEEDRSVLVPVDVSLPSQPRLGKPIATGLEGTLQLVGGVGLLREGADAIRLLDLADPCEPRPRGRVALPRAAAEAFLLSRDLMIVDRHAPTQPAFDVYDIADPGTPTVVATVLDGNLLPAGDGWLVCGAGDPSHRHDPRVYKLDGPAQPAWQGVLQSTLSGLGSARRIGDCLYLFGVDASRKDCLEIHLLRNLPISKPWQVLPLGLAPVRVDLLSDRLFVQGHRECRVYDVAAPADPVFAGAFATAADAGAGFAVNGEVATVSGRLMTVRPATFAAASAPAAAGRLVRLGPAQPNPFNPRTTISFTIDRDRDLNLSVYDLRGHLVAALAGGRFAAGRHEVDWLGRDTSGAPVASGPYFVRLHGPGVEVVQAVTLVK